MRLQFAIQFAALTVRILMGMDKHKNIIQISKPRRRYLNLLSSSEIHLKLDELNEVNQIDLKYPLFYPSAS
jgi:hypothetical protein